MAITKTYAQRVKAVEDEGATTSDAQAVVDAEDMIAARSNFKKDAKGLPNNVRQHREKSELSPKDLAAKIGGDWTASTVRRIERGARKATPEQVALLADALQVPVAKLGLALPSVPVEPQTKKPGKVVGKRTGKVLETKEAVKDEIVAVLSA